MATRNVKAAGLSRNITLKQQPFQAFEQPKEKSILITNPPYGERLEEKEDLPALYSALGERFKALDSWSMYMITSYEDAEKYIGRKADKNRKIYNGMLKTYFYQFMGPRPRRREKDKD